jgi:FkbM family methyltransferase
MNGIFYEGKIEENYLGHQIKEIYFDKVYHPFVENRKDLVFLDIGGNIGLTSNYFSQFAKKVYTVEPSAEHFACIQKMVEFNKLGEVIVPINNAVYIQSGKFPLFHNANRTMRSLHMAVNDNSSDPEEVSCITLDQLFSTYQISHVDIMKIDCEGSEAEILASGGFSQVADKIDLVIGEQHSWMGRHPQQLIDALEDRGFKYQEINNEAKLFVAVKQR